MTSINAPEREGGGMTDIPDDMVERVARAIFDKYAEAESIEGTWDECRRASADPDTYPTAARWHALALVEARAAIEAMQPAILAERERCAKVAESHFDLRHADKARFAGMSIAAAIRSQS